MQKIAVCFRNYYLGDLSFKDNNFVYTINPEGVKQALIEGAVPLFLYGVDNSFESEELPNGLKSLIPSENSELYASLGLGECKNDFEKLFVLAGENSADDGLFVSR